MPIIRIVLEDGAGNMLLNTEQVYLLDGDCDTLNQIEAAVETLKRQVLPDLEQNGQCLYLTGSADCSIPLTEVAEAHLRLGVGRAGDAASSGWHHDGARSIRSDLDRMGGRRIPLI